jgi:DnaJ-class molecular chaperone
MRYSEALRVFGLKDDKVPDEKILRKKYLLLSRKCHPDKGGDPAKFKELQEAYAILTKEDGESDDEYEGRRNERDAYFDGIFGGFSDIFSNFQETGPKKPVIKKTRLTVEEFFKGTTREVMIQTTSDCTDCGGTGTGSRVPCADCKGKGMHVTHRKLQLGSQITKTSCKTCNGRGGIGIGSERPCATCRGHRTVVNRIKKHVRIPRGLPNDTKIALHEGDTPTVLQVKQPSHLDREWGDWILTKDRILRIECEIPLEMALLGGEVTVVHPGTKESINVTIPPNTQPTDEIRIPDKGLPACPEARLPPTDACVIAKVTLPVIPEKHKTNTRRFFAALKR